MTENQQAPEAVVRAGRVLVTGAGGFLGANLVWAFHDQGFAVRALVRRPPRGPQWHGLRNVEFVIGDICHPAQVAQAITGVAYVVHAAALTQLIPRPRRLAFRVNVEGTRNVCAAALQAGVRRLVFTSSISTVARGTAEVPATEESRYNLGAIAAPYYASKRLAEQVVREFQGRGLASIIMCPAYLIGPRDVRPTTNQLLLYAAQRSPAFMPPGGMNVLDVRDAALAHVRALWLGNVGERYLLAGPYRSYIELGSIVKQVLGSRSRVRVLPRWTNLPGSVLLSLASGILPWMPDGLSVPNYRYGYVPFHVSGARAEQAFHLGSRPIEDSVSDTLRWFQETGQAPWMKRG